MKELPITALALAGKKQNMLMRFLAKNPKLAAAMGVGSLGAAGLGLANAMGDEEEEEGDD